MSISAINAVWKLATLPGVEKSVLLALADYANADGMCWPSVATLARKCGWSERTVQESVRKLEAMKLLAVEKSVSGGKQTVNRYMVLPGREEGEGRGAPGAPLGVRDVRGEGARSSPLRGARSSPPLNEPPGIEPSERTKDSGGDQKSPAQIVSKKRKLILAGELISEFQAFWTAYPYKQKKPQAEKAFVEARLVENFEGIMAGLARAKASIEWTRTDKDGCHFIPHPASWLNAQGWANEYRKKTETGGVKAVMEEFVRRGQAAQSAVNSLTKGGEK